MNGRPSSAHTLVRANLLARVSRGAKTMALSLHFFHSGCLREIVVVSRAEHSTQAHGAASCTPTSVHALAEEVRHKQRQAAVI